MTVPLGVIGAISSVSYASYGKSFSVSLSFNVFKIKDKSVFNFFKKNFSL